MHANDAPSQMTAGPCCLKWIPIGAALADEGEMVMDADIVILPRRGIWSLIGGSVVGIGLLSALGCGTSSPGSTAPDGGNDSGSPELGAGSLPAGTPKTTVLVGSTLVATQKQLAAGGSAEQKKALARLVQSAEGFLAKGPWSVMDKVRVPPSGDKHDYMTQAPYWWPADATDPPSTPGTSGDCSKGNYVNHDGIRNAGEVDPPALTDRAGLHATIHGIFQLSLAWYYTGDNRYAAQAEAFARHWFLDPATAMNANMNFGQGIPCQATPTLGRGIGIIELAGGYLSDLVDGLAILDLGAPGWTETDQAAMRGWLSRLLTWLTSAQAMPGWADPIAEAKTLNNHGSWYDSSLASLAAYLGAMDTVTAMINSGKVRIDDHVDATGAQYRELARTQAWHYSVYNATALCRLAETANQFGTNLWSYVGAAGGSLMLAMEYLADGAAGGMTGFKYAPACTPPNAGQTAATAAKCSPTQVATVPSDEPGGAPVPAFDPSEPFYDLRAAAAEAMDEKVAVLLPQAPAPGGVDMWPLIPSCRIAVDGNP